jgi:hypothetical protein
MDSSARESNNFTRAISLRGFPNRFKNSIVAAALSARAASYRPSLRFLRTPLSGSLPPAVNLYRSCIRLGWLAHETMGFRLVRASEE